MKPLAIYQSPHTDPCRNLALEEYLFSAVPKGMGALFLWQNRPSVILGRYQNAESEVRLAEAQARDIAIARRLSGGGAVYHDLGNLNYSLILPCADPDSTSLEAFTQPAVRACRRFGADAVFGGRNDIFADGKKLSGSAQYFRDGKLLHHGCIMIGTDLSAVRALLRPKAEKAPAGAEESLASPVTTLSRAAAKPVSVRAFSDALKEELGGHTTARDAAAVCPEEDIARLQARYEDPRWTYGYPPSYETAREKRFPGGLVRVHLRMAEGRIAGAAFSGDFFCTGDLEALCALLCGRPIDAQLFAMLQRSPEARCIRGVTPQDLCRLLAG